MGGGGGDAGLICVWREGGVECRRGGILEDEVTRDVSNVVGMSVVKEPSDPDWLADGGTLLLVDGAIGVRVVVCKVRYGVLVDKNDVVGRVDTHRLVLVEEPTLVMRDWASWYTKMLSMPPQATGPPWPRHAVWLQLYALSNRVAASPQTPARLFCYILIK